MLVRIHGMIGQTQWRERMGRFWRVGTCNAHRPARVSEEHSETAYTTNRALEFLKTA